LGSGLATMVPTCHPVASMKGTRLHTAVHRVNKFPASLVVGVLAVLDGLAAEVLAGAVLAAVHLDALACGVRKQRLVMGPTSTLSTNA